MYYFVYILSNEYGSVLYVGFTRDLRRRVYEHKHKLVKGFTKKYNVDKLLYYEKFSNPKDGIVREKQIKKIFKKKERRVGGNRESAEKGFIRRNQRVKERLRTGDFSHSLEMTNSPERSMSRRKYD